MDFKKLRDMMRDPTQMIPEQPPIPQITPEEQRNVEKDSRISDFLEKQHILEASGFNDPTHKTITDPKSIHYGTAAVGKYGLMPRTIDEIVNRNKDNPNFLDGTKDLSGKSTEELREIFKQHPMYEEQLGRALAEHVMKKQGGDIERSDYSWKYGHNLPPERITDEKLNKDERTKRLRKLLDKPILIQQYKR